MALAQAPCSCAAPPKYTTRTITKQVPVTKMVAERVPVTGTVMVKKNVPYEVTVKQPVVTEEPGMEDYWETSTEDYFITKQETKEIPIVTRQCTDASGKFIKTIKEVALHHSGPAPKRQSEFNLGGDESAKATAEAKAPESASTCGGPGQEPCGNVAEVDAGAADKLVVDEAAVSKTACGAPGQDPCEVLNYDFTRASLVNAPLDRNLGGGMGLVQIGVVDPRLHGNWASANGRPNMMQGQWGGQPQ